MNTSFLWAVAISLAAAAGIFLGIRRMRTCGSSIGTNPLDVEAPNPPASARDTR